MCVSSSTDIARCVGPRCAAKQGRGPTAVMYQWYLAHTHVRAEQKASVHLRRQGFGVYLPQYEAQRNHARRRDWIKKPLFPCYLFVGLDLARDRWRAVHSTVGVRSLLSAGDQPLALPPEVIEEIRAREDSRGFVMLGGGCSYHRGDRVRVTEGPFVDTAGLFDYQSDEERVVILLDLLGRQVKASVPLRAIMPDA